MSEVYYLIRAFASRPLSPSRAYLLRREATEFVSPTWNFAINGCGTVWRCVALVALCVALAAYVSWGLASFRSSGEKSRSTESGENGEYCIVTRD